MITMKNIIGKILAVGLAVLFLSLFAQAQSGMTQYIYDDNGRLTAVIAPNGETAVYTYDAAGNIVSITRQTNPIVTINSFSFNQQECVSAETFRVTISGTGFIPDPAQNIVKFGGITATVESAAQNEIVVAVPPNFFEGTVSVTNNNGSYEKQLDLTEIFSSIEIAPNPNSPVSLNLANAGQTLSLCFDGTGNKNISFLLENIGFPSLDIKILDPSGNILSNENYPTADGRIFVDSKVLSEMGIYYIKISSPDNQTGNLNASLYEFEDISTALTSDGTPANVSIVKPGQNAKLQLSTNGATFGLSSPNSTISNYSIYVVRNYDGQIIRTISSLPVTVNGLNSDYSLILDPSGPATGDMALQLEPLSIPTDGTPEEIVIDSPHESSGRTFAASAGQSFTLQVSNVTVRPSLVSIIAPDGSSVASDFIDVYFTGAFLRFTIPADGVYTVLFTPYYAYANSTGSGIFSLHLLSEANGTLVINNPATTFVSDVPGQPFRITFAGTRGQRFALRKNDDDDFYHLSLKIINPDETELLSISRFDETTVVDVNNLPQTGNYTMLLQPNFDSQYGNLILQAVDDNVFISNTQFEYFNTYFYSTAVTDLTGSSGLSKKITGKQKLAGEKTEKTSPQTTNLLAPTATYYYNGTADEQFSFGQYQQAPPSLNLTGGTMTIYLPDGTVLNESSLDSGICNITLPEDGTYRIEVAPEGGTQSFLFVKQCGGGGNNQFGKVDDGKKLTKRNLKAKQKIQRRK